MPLSCTWLPAEMKTASLRVAVERSRGARVGGGAHGSQPVLTSFIKQGHRGQALPRALEADGE